MSAEMFTINNLWIMIAAALVFVMHLGFACVETGLTRAKNTVNILFKNTMIPCIGLMTYAICGWKIMYPGDAWILPNVFSFGFGILGDNVPGVGELTAKYNAGYTIWTDFLFQGMFAATAATIVSGAVAGRVKLAPFLIFSALFVAISYPITGSWQWGGGWLSQLGFYDFAGSTLVHAVGGAGALVGAMMLGPRLGKYAKDGTMNPIPGHSIPLAAIGVFLLWFGWFGFNGGSVLSADAAGVSLVLVTTAMAAAGGGMAAGIISWFFVGKPDVTMALNGILAGLVGITAGPDLMTWWESAFVIGPISGALVFFSVLFFDKLKIDDPVGAISVHLVCGIFGTLACGIFGVNGLYGTSETAGGMQLIYQLVGAGSVIGFTLLTATILFGALKSICGIRVSEYEEIEGLDLGEHDMSAYPDFQRTYIKSYHAREI
ncbi:ammonium transporter [Poriferisphaera sp. WC338]|uniref:ammonium transporter n=1 Tax=Poriferisphaera sp. WC338 TaxID=3425129 RepID=UPI003D819104